MPADTSYGSYLDTNSMNRMLAAVPGLGTDVFLSRHLAQLNQASRVLTLMAEQRGQRTLLSWVFAGSCSFVMVFGMLN